MRNLAGVQDCDAQVVGELALAGIPFEKIEGDSKSEVPTHYRGALVVNGIGAFTFRRAWYYWVVAQRLYADPVGKQDVRVTGHAACPPPEHPWVKHLDADGKQLAGRSAEAEWRKYKDNPSLSEYLAKYAAEHDARVRYVDDPAAEASRSIVDMYHIDSQDGLNLFVRELQGHD